MGVDIGAEFHPQFAQILKRFERSKAGMQHAASDDLPKIVN
jgi:hypothetical protein